MIFLPVQILVQSDFPLHLKIKKNVRQKKGFFTISIFNLKLLWYFCFRWFFMHTRKCAYFEGLCSRVEKLRISLKTYELVRKVLFDRSEQNLESFFLNLNHSGLTERIFEFSTSECS